MSDREKISVFDTIKANHETIRSGIDAEAGVVSADKAVLLKVFHERCRYTTPVVFLVSPCINYAIDHYHFRLRFSAWSQYHLKPPVERVG